MTKIEPTAEQQAILAAGRDRDDNLLITARAGAAKTTSIEMLAHELSSVSILCCAFNKKIADELASRLPRNAQAKTLNSIGNRAWREYIGHWPKVDGKKTLRLFKTAVSGLPEEDREDAWDSYQDIASAVDFSKAAGYLPEDTWEQARPLIGDDSFFDLLDFRPSPFEKDLIKSICKRSFQLAVRGDIDFNDQVFCPAIMACSFEHYDLIMVDEAQDLSSVNHAMLRKMCRRSRLIAVGDPCQAIYGFRGANEDSMSQLRQMFSMHDLYLTICFRSSQHIIENARWRAPDMQWRPGAPEGTVQTLDEWGPPLLEPGDAIICRNNAPLFTLAINLLRCKLHPELASGDMIRGLLAVMKRFGPAKMPQSEAIEALERWTEAELKKRKNITQVKDRAACIRVFLDETETLGDAMTFLRDISQRAGRIKLMTGHKAKGLEFDRVWFLDQHLLKDKGQDRNVRYVIQTRARHTLFNVESAGWNPELEIDVDTTNPM